MDEMHEAGMREMGDCEHRPPEITFERRQQLTKLALAQAERITEQVRPHERRWFRALLDLMVARD